MLLGAHNLKKSYRRRRVVDGVDIEVGPAEVVGLLGPNGAGKSTSFGIVAGLIRADSGTVTLEGKSLERFPLYQRARMGLGYLPQESTIFRGLSVEDNLRVYFEAQGIKGRDIAKSIDALLSQYRLEHVRENLGSELSGGERRRVEMARTLVPRPKVVLLDEPFAGVDPIAVGEIKGFIEMMRERGIGVLLTDHNVRETLGSCDRAYLISSGKILLSGTPEAIVENPLARESYLGQDFSM